MTCVIVGCDNPVENRDTWLCATHSAQRRKALKDEQKIKIVKPIRKMSPKKAKEVPQYSKLKKAFLEEKMVCEIQLKGCLILATQIHHCSKSDKNFLNKATWKRSCANCHHRIEFELSAEQRRSLGLLTD